MKLTFAQSLAQSLGTSDGKEIRVKIGFLLGKTSIPYGPATPSVGLHAQLGRISPKQENSPKWETKFWVHTGDCLPNGRTLFYKALYQLRGTFASDENMINGFLGSNYPISPSTSKFHRLLLE